MRLTFSSKLYFFEGEILNIAGLAISPQSTPRSRRSAVDINVILSASSAFSAVKSELFKLNEYNAVRRVANQLLSKRNLCVK